MNVPNIEIHKHLVINIMSNESKSYNVLISYPFYVYYYLLVLYIIGENALKSNENVKKNILKRVVISY